MYRILGSLSLDHIDNPFHKMKSLDGIGNPFKRGEKGSLSQVGNPFHRMESLDGIGNPFRFSHTLENTVNLVIESEEANPPSRTDQISMLVHQIALTSLIPLAASSAVPLFSNAFYFTV